MSLKIHCWIPIISLEPLEMFIPLSKRQLPEFSSGSPRDNYRVKCGCPFQTEVVLLTITSWLLTSISWGLLHVTTVPQTQWYIVNHLNYNNEFLSYYTRSSFDFRPNHSCNGISYRYFLNCGVQLWNSINDDTKSTKNTLSFIREFKDQLLNLYNCSLNFFAALVYCTCFLLHIP